MTKTPYEKLIDRIFCEGTWSHKYNESKNLRVEQETGLANDRTAYDVGTEQELKTNEG